MIPIGAPAIVVRSQVQLAPHMLWNVIKEGGSEISNHEDDEHRHDT
jgi:hypothetical protein